MQNNNRIFTSTSRIALLPFAVAVFSFASLQCCPRTEVQNSKGFAVVELFTSEGCAHCPPAHELLAKIQNENPGKKIYALAYHVDFWDREKRKDSFSNPQFSRRQISYAERLNVPSIYAPQIVVNGKKEFVGTDEVKINNFIDELLTRRSQVTLSIEGTQNEDELRLNYQVTGGSKNGQLQIAIVKKFSDGKVEEGTHTNHLFTHVQTVRHWHSELLSKDGKGSTTIKLPQGFNRINWEVVAMIQDLNKNGEISAATKVSL